MPHRVLLSPCPDLHTHPRISARHSPVGIGGITEDCVWFSWLRSAGRLLRWHCVRRQSSSRLLRLRQGSATAQDATRRRVTSVITSGGITVIGITGTSLGCRAGMPASRACMPAAWPASMPASRRALQRFQAKWLPVRVKKTRKNRNLEPRSDSIGSEMALTAATLPALTLC